MGTNSTQSVPASQIAQIVNLNQSGINVGHGHQIVCIENVYTIISLPFNWQAHSFCEILCSKLLDLREHNKLQRLCH